MKYESDVIYHCLGNDFDQGVLSCGFMAKPNERSSQIDFMINYYSCFVLLQGKGIYRDETGLVYELGSGDLVQRLPGRVHSTQVIADGQWLEFYISLGRGLYESLAEMGLLETEKPVIQSALSLSSQEMDMMSNLLETMKGQEGVDSAHQLLEVQRSLLYFHQQSRQQAKEKPWIETAKANLRASLDQEIDLKGMARDLQMGYESFRKAFKKEVGMSPALYRRQQRMRQGLWMLRYGTSIKETSQLLGYGDVYAFTKQFSKTFGYPPGQVQKM